MWGRGTRFLQRSFVFISEAPGLFKGNVDIALFPSPNSLCGQDDTSSSVVSIALSAWKEKNNNLTLEKDWAEENGLDEEDALAGEFKEGERFTERVKARDQIIKQAIIMSLCKENIVKYHLEERPYIDSLSDASFVPVLGIDKTSFMVALYDSEYDYLLLTTNSEEILDHPTWQLSPQAIIHLWMIIHHNQFCCKPPHSFLKYFKGTCRLQEQVGGAHSLEHARRNSYWTYMRRRDLDERRNTTERLSMDISERDTVLFVKIDAFNAADDYEKETSQTR